MNNKRYQIATINIGTIRTKTPGFTYLSDEADTPEEALRLIKNSNYGKRQHVIFDADKEEIVEIKRPSEC